MSTFFHEDHLILNKITDQEIDRYGGKQMKIIISTIIIATVAYYSCLIIRKMRASGERVGLGVFITNLVLSLISWLIVSYWLSVAFAIFCLIWLGRLIFSVFPNHKLTKQWGMIGFLLCSLPLAYAACREILDGAGFAGIAQRPVTVALSCIIIIAPAILLAIRAAISPDEGGEMSEKEA